MSDVIEGHDGYTGASFTMGNRARRLAWNLAYWVLYRPSPFFMNGWRSFLLRSFGAKVGKGCKPKRSVRIWAPWNLAMGDYCIIADGVNCYSMGPITMGDKVIISQGAHLCAGTHDYESPNFQLYTSPIVIGNQAWICAEAFVGPGVTIGEGAVIGARACATKDMPAWMVCAGNPCKPIKPRGMREA